MKVISAASELEGHGRNVCLAIGFFDGVHLGHQQVIRQTISDAQQHESLAVVLTFDRHPNLVVATQRVPQLIYSLPQKLRAIGELGGNAILLLQFDRAFSEQSGEEFIRNILRDFQKIQSISVGASFLFGHKRSGNVALLKKMGAELKFAVHGLSAVGLDGKPVSSTRIRQAIAAGNLNAASQMLGRAYSFSGAVLPGDKLGRNIGFPTANIETIGLVLPPNGVYAAHAKLEGKAYRTVLNIGYRPTLKEPTPQLRVEAHLLEFNRDIYGCELELFPLEKLRDEQKFPSLQALKEQIARDITKAGSIFG
jgi:riboflavin kinase/FMN adenylyltransferase